MKLQTLRRRLSRNLKRLRLASGLTLQGLAERADLNKSEVQRIEAGKANLTVKTLGCLAAGLGVDPAELVRDRPGTSPLDPSLEASPDAEGPK